MAKKRDRILHQSDRMRNPRRIDPTLFVFLGYAVIFFLLFKVSPSILGALTLGWYLSMIIEVPSRLLARIKFMPYKLAIIISSILVYALLLIGFSRLIPLLIDEGKRLFDLLKKSAADVDWNSLLFIRNEFIRERILRSVDDLLSLASGQVAVLGGDVLNWIVQRAPNAMTATLIFIIAASYFTAAVPVLRANLWRFFPKSSREKAIAFTAEFYADLRHFIGGQVLIALLVGLSVGFGMLIVGIPYSLFLGFLSGITNFVPFLGLIIAGVPALLVGVANGGWWGLGKVLIVIAITNQLESWVFSPRIQGKRMKLNWFVIIIAIFFSAQLLGLIGVLLAIPFLVFLRRFWVQYVQEAFRRL